MCSATPGQRMKVGCDFSKLTKNKPEKCLLSKRKSTGGRNNTGRMTMRYRGGGHKKMLRNVDFKRQKDNVEAFVETIEYDPCRTAFISLIQYADGEKSYILTPEGLKVGDKVMSGVAVQPEIGCCLQLKNIPVGTFVHNVELNPGGGGKIAKSAGNSVQIVSKDCDFVSVKLPSGETRLIYCKCRATVGIVSNATHRNEVLGKAGKNRVRGRRPRNRGVSMNPVDHPMGGGEGKASGGHPRSRKGKKAKGAKTVIKSKKYSARFRNVI
jgi:large subunit ribosomal protein L2